MKVGRPEGEPTVVGYSMPLVVAVSFAVELMMTSIEDSLIFFQQIMPSQGKPV
jgi:hypothetical protein